MRLLLLRHAEAQRIPTSDTSPPKDEGLTPKGRAQAKTLALYLKARRDLETCDAFLCSPFRRTVETAEVVAAHLKLPVLEVGSRYEDLAEGLTRVGAVLEGLAQRYRGQTVVGVTHAGFIFASLFVLFGMSSEAERARLDPKYTSLTEWSLSDGVWRLECYNVVPLGYGS